MRLQKAIDCHKCHLQIAKEVGNRAGEANAYGNLGNTHNSRGDHKEAIDCYQRSIATYNYIWYKLDCNDEWKVSFRNVHEAVYASLWRLLLKQGKTVEALFYAEQGRAQALIDLMELKYGLQAASAKSERVHVTTWDIFSCLSSNTVFIGIDRKEIIFWVSGEGQKVELRRKQINDDSRTNNAYIFAVSNTECVPGNWC